MKKLYSYDELLKLTDGMAADTRMKFLDRYDIFDKERKLWAEKSPNL